MNDNRWALDLQKTVCWLVVATLGHLAGPVLAQEWPQWRGPQRDGQAPSFEAPETWPAEPTQVWRQPVGAGYSSPVASDGRICLHTREGEAEVVTCHDVRTGEPLWRAEYPATFSQNSYATKHGKGPNATPVLAEGRLHTLGMSGIVSTFDVATGKLLWRFDGSEQVSSEKLFCGTSASPLIDGGALIVQLGDDIGGGGVTAFDPATGDVRWTWKGAGPGYASPVVVEVAGTRQIVTMTQRSILGLDAADGALLWEIDFEDEWNENIVTPIFRDDVLIAAGVRRGTLARQLTVDEGRWQPEVRWSREDLPQYMSSPVLDGSVLYGFSSRQKGQLFALDVATGATAWESEGRQGQNAAVVAAGSRHLAVLTTEGELLFVDRTPEALEIVARYTVAEGGTWSHPALWGQQVLVKDASALTLWDLAPTTTPEISTAGTSTPQDTTASAPEARQAP